MNVIVILYTVLAFVPKTFSKYYRVVAFVPKFAWRFYG